MSFGLQVQDDDDDDFGADEMVADNDVVLIITFKVVNRVVVAGGCSL